MLIRRPHASLRAQAAADGRLFGYRAGLQFPCGGEQDYLIVKLERESGSARYQKFKFDSLTKRLPSLSHHVLPGEGAITLHFGGLGGIFLYQIEG